MDAPSHPAGTGAGSPRAEVEATAAVWLSLRDRGLSPSETAEFVRWLQVDPRHATAFAELDRTWRDFDRAAALQVVAPRERPCAEHPVRQRRRDRNVRVLGWAAGLASAAALMVGVWLRPPSPRHTAETAIGVLQKLDLPDGSVALLNTDSAIDAAFTAGERRVRIVRGEVFFTVTPEAERPFIVTAGPVVVRAVGTAFNVHRQTGAVEVLVTEGRVRVTEAGSGRSLLAVRAAPEGELGALGAGERAVVPTAEEGAAAVPVGVAALDQAAVRRQLAWQERRLEFDEVPLAEIVGQFNRHNRVRLVIDDPELARQRFSGVFRADGQESLLRLLQNDFGVQIDRRSEEVVLRPALSRSPRGEP